MLDTGEAWNRMSPVLLGLCAGMLFMVGLSELTSSGPGPGSDSGPGAGAGSPSATCVESMHVIPGSGCAYTRSVTCPEGTRLKVEYDHEYEPDIMVCLCPDEEDSNAR